MKIYKCVRCGACKEDIMEKQRQEVAKQGTYPEPKNPGEIEKLFPSLKGKLFDAKFISYGDWVRLENLLEHCLDKVRVKEGIDEIIPLDEKCANNMILNTALKKRFGLSTEFVLKKRTTEEAVNYMGLKLAEEKNKLRKYEKKVKEVIRRNRMDSDELYYNDKHPDWNNALLMIEKEL